MSLFFKHLPRGAAIAMVAALAVPAVASADAPDVKTATGSVVSSDATGTVVEVHGTWEWTTHHSDCNNDKRAVGVAIDWGDGNGNHVATLGADSIDVGVLNATALNAADNLVHPAEPGVDTSTLANWRGGCGTFNGNFNTGNWGPQQHKFPPGPLPQICALMYDVHLASNGGAPNNQSEITAGGNNHNDDNSAQKNAQTPAGNVCASITIPPPPPPPPPPPGPPPARNPAIHIEKTGPATANAGDTVTYLLDVSNTGDQSFAEANVVVTDPLCSTTPALIAQDPKPGDASPGSLDPGDHWFYSCGVATTAGQTAIHNVATVTGTDAAGDTVSDDDDADTTLTQPQIGVLPQLPGSARLRGPSGCLAGGPHRIVVTGRRIARVTFFLDGKRVAVRRKADRLGRFTYTVNRARLRTGSHTVVARVTYLPETTPGRRTFRQTFAKCARAVRPQFTG